MAKFLLLSFTAVLLSFTIATAKITVACAANMQYAMQEIMAAFNKKDTTVNAVYGASGNLVTQIKNGAPFDIFVSADMSYPESLFVNKDAIAKPKIYAYGKLVILSMKKGIVDKGISVLKDPGIKTIAVPDPLHAPYGREAMKALKRPTSTIQWHHDLFSARAFPRRRSILSPVQPISVLLQKLSLCRISLKQRRMERS